MDAAQFQKELRLAYDERVEVFRDQPGPHLLVGDHCWVVWDRTKKDGTPYPVIKIACETDAPALQGTPRDPTLADVHKLQKMNWSNRFGHRSGKVDELFRKLYLDPEKKRKADYDAAIEEAARGRVRDYVHWRMGIRNTIAVRPHSSKILTGDRRSRDEELRIKRNLRIREGRRG